MIVKSLNIYINDQEGNEKTFPLGGGVPAVVGTYTYDGKRMGGAPTITATIYYPRPLDNEWKHEAYVYFNGEKYYATATPSSSKDNEKNLYKHDITFTSRRELLDNTLFFDVVSDDTDTQNKDKYRSNQTKFTFGGDIYEFVARINSSMAYCGLYRPNDADHGYYVVVDEGYGTDEVKEVSFEDQYLTDVLQLINTTYELTYYWVGNVCHVGKVQNDLTATPIKYGRNDALLSVNKENANYKIVDAITGYGSTDNLPYYYPNDDEFGEAVFSVENTNKNNVNIELSKALKTLGNNNCYNNRLTLYKVSNGDVTSIRLDYVNKFGWFASSETTTTGKEPVTRTFGDWVVMYVDAKIGTKLDFSSLNIKCEYQGNGNSNLVTEQKTPIFTITWKNLSLKANDGESIEDFKKRSEGVVVTDKPVGTTATLDIIEAGIYEFNVKYTFEYKTNSYRTKDPTTGVTLNVYASKENFKITKDGYLEMSYTPKLSEYVFKDTISESFYNSDNVGITINNISEGDYNEAKYSFDVRKEDVHNSGSKVDVYYINLVDVNSNEVKQPIAVTITGRKWLDPSQNLMPSIYRESGGAERFYFAKNNTYLLPDGSGKYYEFANQYKEGNPHQGSVSFDDIKPTINGIRNDVLQEDGLGQLFGEIADVAFDSADSDVKDSDSNYIHSYFYIKLHKFSGDFGFDLFKHALASESAKLNLIKSNGCPACSFEIGCVWSADKNKCYNLVSTDGNGNLKSVKTEYNDYILDNNSAMADTLNQDTTQKEIWIAVKKEDSTLGIVMPNASAGFKPQKGDLFVLTGIKPPKVLVTAAEKRLDDALIKYMSENNEDQFNYSIKFSRIFLQENPNFAKKLNENSKLSVEYNGETHEVFVSNYTVKVEDNILAEVEVELVNSLEVTQSEIKQMIDSVKGETIKQLNNLAGGNNNNFNASVTDKLYLSKQTDDIAQGTITFEKIQKFLKGLLIGDFNTENGGSWTPDGEGRSHLVTDYLEVRMKAIFEELVIKKTSTIGGKEIISPAGGVVTHKVDEVTVTYNNVSQKAYRCYFLAEQDGDAIDNDFAVGDQVRSESFNVSKGTYHKVGNHFYWRLVIGRDEEPVELEGKKYHYIDLSDTDCATASDTPAKGDVLNQCGNRSDVERQNCLIFSAVDAYSPCITLYHGINSYSFANKEYVDYGVNKATNKAFFNVYGDMYVGDRPTKENDYEGSSYIKYDSESKQVEIKGKISAKSSVDGKTLDKYIQDNAPKGLSEGDVNNLINNSQVISDLQNQIDGAIETWFYDGVPTLNNAPASGWKTDNDKNVHLGDLYYDNNTGKAYRFALDGGTYKWVVITDTDITKALNNAAKAQETADGKMKVFSTQPKPPYQLGDIWVNATYPSDGSTYKNDVLRCKTAKTSGTFSISDWMLASKYTDDTVANAAKAAVEKAQKAAETAQSNVNNLGKTVTSNKTAFDNYVSDGYLEPSEIAAMAQDSKRLEDDFAAAEKSYNEVKDSEVLAKTKQLTDLVSAFNTFKTAKTELITYLSDIATRYNAANADGKATIVSAVNTKYSNFQAAYSAFYDKLGLANAYITSKIVGDLGVVIGDMTSLAYLKKALTEAPDTEINGGLVLSSLIGLRDTDGNTTAGINGITEKSAKGGGVAAWFGGEMVDKDYNDGSKTPANTIFRFDGSGYVAGGAIWWGTDGKVHADPTSFIISEKNLGAYLTFFEPTWKTGSAGTSVADLVSLKPNAPFNKLQVSGDATFEGAITFHGVKISYDSANKAIKIDGNVYATGGITAYGAGSAQGGGGMNGSVVSYADIIAGNYTDSDVSSIPNAYAIKALSSRIDNISDELGGLNLSWGNITDKPSTFAPSAHTHKWADISDRPTKVSAFTNDKGYLTSHQDISGKADKSQLANYLPLSGGDVYGNVSVKCIRTDTVFIEMTKDGKFNDRVIDCYAGALHIQNASAEDFTICRGGGNVGIGGDSTTTDKLRVYGTIRATSFVGVSWSDIGGRPSSLPASDVYSWAKASTKPNYYWSEIGSRPTKVSQFVNDSGYITSSTSISGNAATATKLQTACNLWGNSFDGTTNINGGLFIRTRYTDTSYYALRLSGTSGDLYVGEHMPNIYKICNYDSNGLFFDVQNAKMGYDVSDPNAEIELCVNDMRVSSKNRSQSLEFLSTNDPAINCKSANWFHITSQKGLIILYVGDYDYTKYIDGLLIDKNNNVSIGVRYPQAKLHVNGNILATGDITAYSSSDIRLKHDLQRLDCLLIIRSMGGTFGFTWNKDGKHSIGWIAQHVLNNPLMADLVERDDEGYLKINYWSPKLIATAFGAIEQVDDEVSRLKARVTFLESEVERLTRNGTEKQEQKRLEAKEQKLLS